MATISTADVEAAAEMAERLSAFAATSSPLVALSSEGFHRESGCLLHTWRSTTTGDFLYVNDGRGGLHAIDARDGVAPVDS